MVTLEKESVRARTWDEVALVVRRAQDGDREAFGRLVEQFQPTPDRQVKVWHYVLCALVVITLFAPHVVDALASSHGR